MAAPRVWQSKQKGDSSTADADTCRRKARMINWRLIKTYFWLLLTSKPYLMHWTNRIHAKLLQHAAHQVISWTAAEHSHLALRSCLKGEREGCATTTESQSANKTRLQGRVRHSGCRPHWVAAGRATILYSATPLPEAGGNGTSVSPHLARTCI